MGNSFQEVLLSFLRDLACAVIWFSRVNAVLSPIFFLILTFWLIAFFYTLSKVLYIRPIDSLLDIIVGTMTLVSYSLQYFILVMLSSKIPLTISQMKTIIVQVPIKHPFKIFSLFDTNMLIMNFDNFMEDVAITKLGLLKSDLNVLLGTAGAVNFYELLIVQILES